MRPEKIRDMVVNAYRNPLRLAVIRLLGGKCVKCGNTDWRVLQIDHIHGGGNEERRIYKGSYYRMILALPDDVRRERYQVLCANHNLIKQIEGEENWDYDLSSIPPGMEITPEVIRLALSGRLKRRTSS